MLQQTRVGAVITKYGEFLRDFPKVEHLARAPQPAVLAAWTGLGYYRRARSMHLAAQQIVSEHEVRFPQTAEEWQKLPGIGRYTAAAIASITRDEKVAVVDGNVERVTERLLGRRLATPEVWAFAEDLLSPERPGDFNQAMMELGATICVPGEPKCPECSVARWCRTRGKLADVRKQQGTTKVTVFYALDCAQGKVRLAQRSSEATVMPSMWELPLLTPDPDDARVFLRLKHSIMETNYDVGVVKASVQANAGKKIAVADLGEVPLTGLARKILRAAEILS